MQKQSVRGRYNFLYDSIILNGVKQLFRRERERVSVEILKENVVEGRQVVRNGIVSGEL